MQDTLTLVFGCASQSTFSGSFLPLCLPWTASVVLLLRTTYRLQVALPCEPPCRPVGTKSRRFNLVDLGLILKLLGPKGPYRLGQLLVCSSARVCQLAIWQGLPLPASSIARISLITVVVEE